MLKLMPGSGINADTVGRVVEVLYPLDIKEFHLSAGAFVDSETGPAARAGKSDFGMGDWTTWRTRADEVREVRSRAENAVRHTEA